MKYLTRYDIFRSEKNMLCKKRTNTNPLSAANTEGIFCGARLPYILLPLSAKPLADEHCDYLNDNT